MTQVGLLPKDNVGTRLFSSVHLITVLTIGRKEQVGFAYQMYSAKSGKKNDKLAFGFKTTFSRVVKVDFMGCW